MTALPRLLTIMGSGETSPTMTSVHAALFERLGPPPVPAVLLDTAVGFQENAGEVSAKAVQYFRENVGREVDVATWRRADTATPLEYETMLARVREARYVFAGPGSPTYALRQWHASAVPEALVEKVRHGGCVVFSSAAACTLGRLALPVYEVYKCGEDPHWLDGLDILGRATGIRAAVIPHYNNAEGGTHDTRYCYMGERRLRLLEDMLPEGAFILGVDEHTSCVLDLDAQTATVRGNGAVTLRVGGVERRIEAGTEVPLDLLRSGGAGLNGAAPVADVAAEAPVAGHVTERSGDPLRAGIDERIRDFDAALVVGRVDQALEALLSLDSLLWDWSRDTLDSDAMDRGRSALRTMLVRLGDLARVGARDPRDLVAPFVDAVLELRSRARADRRFADADLLRDTLASLGVEVRDTPDGTDWVLPQGFGRDASGQPAPSATAREG